MLPAGRRAARRSGWLPWTALAAGTAGSLAANIAAAYPDPVSRIIAGWPAVALLIAVKLLSGILETREHPWRPRYHRRSGKPGRRPGRTRNTDPRQVADRPSRTPGRRAPGGNPARTSRPPRPAAIVVPCSGQPGPHNPHGRAAAGRQGHQGRPPPRSPETHPRGPCRPTPPARLPDPQLQHHTLLRQSSPLSSPLNHDGTARALSQLANSVEPPPPKNEALPPAPAPRGLTAHAPRGRPATPNTLTGAVPTPVGLTRNDRQNSERRTILIWPSGVPLAVPCPAVRCLSRP